MGGNGNMIIRFETKEEVEKFLDFHKSKLGFINETKPGIVDYAINAVSGKTLNKVCQMAEAEATSYCYAKWRYIGVDENDIEQTDKLDIELHWEKYCFLNTIICNADD